MVISRRLVVLIAIVALFVGLLGTGVVSAQRLARENTFYIAGHQWGPPTSFNPVGRGSVSWPINNKLYIYETLYAFNLVTGELDPILSEKQEWVEDDMVYRVTLFEGTRWQDGEPLTAEDVYYTLDLGRRYPVSYAAWWNYVDDVRVVDDRTIDVVLDPEKPHRTMIVQDLGTIRILPKHIWQAIEDEGQSPQDVANMEPVGSGPYKVLNYNPQQITLVRDDNYWGQKYFGTPAPDYLAHPIFKSNDAGNLALERGQIDFSQQFVPEIWKMWEDKGLPVGTWYDDEPYYMPGSIPSLFINVHRPALDNVLVRRAIAYAIDYAKIAETAMSRYSIPARSSMIIPYSVPEQQYFSEADAQKYGWEYDPAKAVDILENELGATKGNDGIYVLPDGTRLGPWTVTCPYGWTDWMTSLEVVAASARAVGIDIRTEFPDAPVWTDHLQAGDFDLTMNTPAGGQGPALPWTRFRDVLDDRDIPPLGQTAYRNWNRFSHPDVAGLLDKAAFTSDEAALTEIYQALDRIVMENIPVIALEYRPWEFWEFNETYWTGFPTSENPTAPPQHNLAGVRLLYVIKKK
ncbi:MAG: ABC transporter substrate-binding protein [Firmicutes bacterium]|nr:ABC transporter substrate-binding protein [Bacillota bacterium]